MKKSIILGLMVAVSMTMAGCGDEADAGITAVEKTIPVQVETIKASTVYENFYGVGILSAKSEYDVIAEQSGTVKHVAVRVGDMVKKGQVLMEVENDTLVREVSNKVVDLQTKLDTAALTLSEEEENYEQNFILHESGAVSTSELNTAASKLKQAELNYNRAYEEFNLSAQTEKEKIADTVVRSPIDGLVAATFVRVGQEVSNTTVFKVINDSQVVAKVNVTSEAIGLVEAGGKARVYLNGDRSSGLDGLVNNVNKVTGSNAFLYPVEVEINNAQGLMKSGDYTEVELILKERPNRVVIPVDTVLDRLNNPHVFISNNGIAEVRPVKLGYNNGETVEIVSGLKTGEKLVVEGQTYVEEGAVLKVSN